MRLRAVRAGSGSASHARECCERCGRRARHVYDLPWSQVITHSASCPATELSSIAIDRYRSPSIAIDIYMRRERAKRETTAKQLMKR